MSTRPNAQQVSNSREDRAKILKASCTFAQDRQKKSGAGGLFSHIRIPNKIKIGLSKRICIAIHFIIFVLLAIFQIYKKVIAAGRRDDPRFKKLVRYVETNLRAIQQRKKHERQANQAGSLSQAAGPSVVGNANIPRQHQQKLQPKALPTEQQNVAGPSASNAAAQSAASHAPAPKEPALPALSSLLAMPTWKRGDKDLYYDGCAAMDGENFPSTGSRLGRWFDPRPGPPSTSPNVLAKSIVHNTDVSLAVAQKVAGDLSALGERMTCAQKVCVSRCRLLPLHQRLRRFQFRLRHRAVAKRVPLVHPHDQPLFHGSYLRGTRQTRNAVRAYNQKQDEQERRRREEQRGVLRGFLKTVERHQKRFVTFHKKRRKTMSKLAHAVEQYHQKMKKDLQREEDRMTKKRLKALKENDMDAYMELVEQTKNTRLQHLLRETESYLKSLGELIVKQKEAVKDGKLDGASQRASGDAGDVQDKNAPLGVMTGDSYNSMAHANKVKIRRQPEMLVGGTLKSYQMRGLEWLVSLYKNNLNGILADEMGLGKTIQTIALLAYLSEVMHNNGPFLVVVPLSTLSNWANELEKWAPDLVVVIYKGNPEKRKELYKTEMKSNKYNVLLTTYEYTMRDTKVLRKPLWQYIIVDEGHRMKNAKSKFSMTLGNMYKSQHRLLLTGTPLQNNLPELWALLNFLLPHIFHSIDNFEKWFNQPFDNFSHQNGGEVEGAGLKEEEKLLVIHRLHQVMRPFLLRRIKSDVLDQLPEKVEKVVKCHLSGWQKLLYNQIQKNGAAIVNPTSKRRGGSTKGLSNIIMHLRKTCNHPYLFLTEYDINFDIIRSSGKLELLDRMLVKLKATGHRVLIFSQMTQVMTVLVNYFRFRDWRYLRLDGHTKQEDRDNAMHRYNSPDSPYFVFLLSTRAGGLGINLASADTVIIFDSDWNPQMDLQAQDRAHRIGQKREVRVFRLITTTPVEERMLERARQKLEMENVVIEAAKFNNKTTGISDRKAAIREILRESREMMESGREESVPDDSKINRMMARGDDEYNIFCRMDKERDEKEKEEWEELKKMYPEKYKGAMPPRLMRPEDVPAWLKEGIANEEARREAERLNHGQTVLALGKRKREEVFYGDNLTDTQFARLIEKKARQLEYDKMLLKFHCFHICHHAYIIFSVKIGNRRRN